MLISLSYIFLVGMFLSWICKKVGLPGLLGMIFTGILLGPYCLGLIDSSLLNIFTLPNINSSLSNLHFQPPSLLFIINLLLQFFIRPLRFLFFFKAELILDYVAKVTQEIKRRNCNAVAVGFN